MEDTGATLMPVWRANLALLTRRVGAATRLARMMTFSASYMSLILSGRRDFSAEFARGIEAVTGLPEGWMDEPHQEDEVPATAREAIDSEQPHARFRGTAHPVRKPPVLRVEPIFGQSASARRDERVTGPESQGRMARVRKIRELAVQDVRRLERQFSVPSVDAQALRARVADAIAAAEPEEPVRADLEGRLEQIEKHREMLLRHVSKLRELLGRLGDG